ncbi:MAG TPA: M12 family metallopeptidase [Polyangiales bacterium]|nr:M12 family metallopeptidase [Polyangiales bacterium]
MSKRHAPNICFDRILPSELIDPRNEQLVSLPNGRTRAISPLRKQWVNGSTIRIRFLSGTAAQQKMVKDIAPEWTKYANLNFEFTTDPRAEIRVAFDAADGAWSYIGTDNSSIPLNAPTLNLGWQDEAVILHEFGHMVGLAHEHQNPEGGLQWNEEIVIRDLSGPPNYWDEATIRHNVLEKYSADQIRGTKFDPDSIMLYAFPDNWTKNPGGTHENTKLSTMDRDFIRSAEMYPGRGAPTVQATEVPIMRGTAGKIGKPGEENLFSFQVERAGRFLIETTGSADLFMTLFGPNSTTQKLAEDDDSGVDTNPQIAASLQPGRYYARVRHYNPSQTGSYEIRVIALS